MDESKYTKQVHVKYIGTITREVYVKDGLTHDELIQALDDNDFLQEWEEVETSQLNGLHIDGKMLDPDSGESLE